MYRGLFRRVPLAALAIPAALMAGCGSDTTTAPRIVSIVALSGLGQSGLVGANLSQPFAIRAADQSGAPVAGETIQWTVLTGGGTVSPSQSVTDADGRASTILRLGSTVGSQTVRAGLQDAAPVIFTATATSAPASLLAAVSGDNQSAVVKTALPAKLVVKASDAFNNPKAGVAVTFTVTQGGGTLSGASATTDASGLASVDWALGATAGAQRVTAVASGITPITFNATGLAAAAANIVIVSGSGQSSAPGARLPDSLVVRVTDAFNNPVKDVSVSWTVAGDAGRVSPATSKTDVNGRASSSWTLGATGGPKEVRAAVSGLTPVDFQAAGTIIFASIRTGGRHTCALDEGGVAYCWGFNGDGQLGTGEDVGGAGPVFAIPQPTAAAGGLTFGALSSGGFHTCGATLSANPFCWGKNVDGRVGDGGYEVKNTPTAVSGVNVFDRMSAGATHSCALTPGGRLYCWGSNVEGQVGLVGGPVVPQDSLSFNKPMALLPAMTFTSIAAGGLHSCAIGGGQTWCWGSNASGQLGMATGSANQPQAIAGGPTLVSVVAGDSHSCGLTALGVAWCWGANGSGQLGTGNTTSASTPTAVTGGLAFASLTAGRSHTCGLTAAGVAYCWGRNATGQLGVGTTTNSNAPVAVGGGFAFAGLSAGDNSSCGVTTGRVAYCWGDNQFGQLGDGSQTMRLLPTKVTFQP